MATGKISKTAIDIYDTETFKNMFLYVGKNWETKELTIFEISPRKNESMDLRAHLIRLTRMIGFNNLSYDYPLLHHFIANKFNDRDDWERICQSMKAKSDELINAVQPKFNRIYNPLIEQLDLYSVWHYDNKARTTS